MCFQEYIAYQCGHRSLGVIRPCPMTTTGHNFPVCAQQPVKQHFAETMCTACERQLHSRWVLIREWEHRWLHEHGACGCEVNFPGLLYTPRVIGDATADTGSRSAGPSSTTDAEKVSSSDSMAANADSSVTNRENSSQGGASPNSMAYMTATAAGSSVGNQASSQGDDENTAAASGDGRIPALFTEAVTSSGETHVSVRMPGLFGAEWLADHRALHEAGQCACPANFAPYKPRIPDEDLTPADRDLLRRWREQEEAKEASKEEDKDTSSSSDIDGQAADSLRRIAEIQDIFGPSLGGTIAPSINLPPRPADLPGAGNQAFEVKKPQEKGRHERKQSRGDKPLKAPNSVQQQFPTLPSHPTTGYAPVYAAAIQQAPHNYPTLPAVPEPAYNYMVPPQHAQNYAAGPQGPQQAYGYAAQEPMGTGPGPFPTYQPHSQHAANQPSFHNPANTSYFPRSFPAHAAYTTHATYANYIPLGASNWSTRPQRVPGKPRLVQGPGPYRTPGLRYANPPPAYIARKDDQGKTHVQQHGEDQQQTGQPVRPYPLPLCGLPIGAGPEGVSHMGSWLNCRLRRGTKSEAGDDDSEEEEGRGGQSGKGRRHSLST
ncbi:hypothetical protein VTK56DRAFT_9178 [Thermocarpiscus australiensis]